MTSTTLEPASLPAQAEAGPRRIRVIHFCPWANRLQDGAEFLRALPGTDLRPRVSDPSDPALLQMARLDCDWHGENARSLGSMRHDGLEFAPVEVVGIPGVLDVLSARRAPGEEVWFILTGQHPQMLGGSAAGFLAACARHGVRTLYYAFDEASRNMPCLSAIAPHLSVLIHDEAPLAPPVQRALPARAHVVHYSWVANLVPFATSFQAEPEEKILFLGSKLGLTAHRRRQIEFLAAKFKDRFTAICDHSVPVADRLGLARYKVGFCPEGRMFATAGMRATHTDRPFWSGCLGLVPVSEDSRWGGRLEHLHRGELIHRYPHGDLKALAAACESALAAPEAERRRIYDHFNRHETVGAVVAAAMHAAGAPARD